ncbi:MAG: hypothetical protein K5770_19790 [Lachnospiraceae bacterium]|nr:hypothetical protein [Lachnospiraceae bacterium]
MKHYIIARFNDNIEWKKLVPEISEHFEGAKKIEGVSDVKIFTSCSDRANRYHIMIEIEMTPEGLQNFDSSYVHNEWKSRYGDMLEKKAIFDCE